MKLAWQTSSAKRKRLELSGGAMAGCLLWAGEELAKWREIQREPEARCA